MHFKKFTILEMKPVGVCETGGKSKRENERERGGVFVCSCYSYIGTKYFCVHLHFAGHSAGVCVCVSVYVFLTKFSWST